MAYTIAFFGTKPYDESSFNDKNKEFGFEIRYYKGHLNKNNVLLTQGVDAVCIFVNDVADAEVIRVMAANGVKLLALRCAGFNNVDLDAAAAAGITVVRVPAYSPYAVAEYTVALMLSLNRKIVFIVMITCFLRNKLPDIFHLSTFHEIYPTSSPQESIETASFIAFNSYQ